MNRIVTSGLLVSLFLVSPTYGTLFMNMDFESYTGSGSDLLPGWSVTPNYEASTLDAQPLTMSLVGLHSTNVLAIAGNYSAFLHAGVTGGGYPYVEVAMWQTADIPTNAGYVEFVTTPLWTNYVSYSFTLGSTNLLASQPEWSSPDLVDT